MKRPLVPVFTVLLYAGGYPLGSLAASAISPFLLIVLRFSLTSALLWSWLLVRQRLSAHPPGPLLPRGAQLWWSILAGVLVQGAQFLGVYWAMAHGVGPGLCALVIAMNPIATALLNRPLRGAPENRWGYLALLSGAAGVVVACAPKLIAHPSLGPGFVATLIALFGLAGGSLLQGRQLAGVDPIAFTAIGTTASIPAAGVLALTEPARITGTPRVAVLLGALVLISALATSLYAACVRMSGARQASVLFAVIPALAALTSWPIQGSAVGTATVIALGLGSIACVAQAAASRRAALTSSVT